MATTLEHIAGRLSELEHQVRLLRQEERPIPMQRKYTRRQAGFRIMHGQDPARVPEGDMKGRMWADARSKTWVSNRLADDDCPLWITPDGIPEEAIQRYEKHQRRQVTSQR